jgi:ATP-dependent RNA helicase SUPV3L1/SUV3
LRKFGVRFGAYNIYIPPLLKPAPRVLALQLWALKQEERATAGLDAVERLAASGRTSIAADKEIDHALYAVAGYRVCGERAVRVDMLERLADIIRPALAWRDGAPGVKPAAAFDGTGCFTVVVGMTSLVGCAGEDFAAILRSLGYRMEKRPKPAAPAAPEASVSEASMSEAVAPDAAAPDALAPEAPESPPPVAAGTEAEPAVVAEEAGESVSEAILAPAGLAPIAEASEDSDPGSISDVAPAPAPVGEAPVLPQRTDSPAPQPLTEPILPQAQEPVSAESAPADSAVTTEVVAEEAPFVEVWRLGRLEGPRRHRRPPRARTQARPENLDRTRARAPAAADAAIPAAAGEAVASTGAVADGTEPRPDRTPRRHRRGRSDQDRQDQNRSDQNRPDQNRPSQSRSDQNRPDRGPRPERHGGPDRAGRGDRPERDPELRAKYVKGRGESRDRRDKAPDPNSPFAKLAALKEQLEANAKERR